MERERIWRSRERREEVGGCWEGVEVEGRKALMGGRRRGRKEAGSKVGGGSEVLKET